MTTPSFKQHFKETKAASKGQESPNQVSLKERILELAKLKYDETKTLEPEVLTDYCVQTLIREEVQKLMKEIENAGFQSLDIIKQKYPRKEQ
jgi:hypothetical protein